MNMPIPARQRGLTMIGLSFRDRGRRHRGADQFSRDPGLHRVFLGAKGAGRRAQRLQGPVPGRHPQRLVERRLGAEYIDSVHAGDIEVIKTGNVTTASASWQTKLHLIGNASILLEFDASASR